MNDKIKPALIGGGSLGVANSIPLVNLLNCACCALVIGGGVLAAHLYFKDTPPTAERPFGDGIMLGALAGVFGAIVSTIISIPMTLLGLGSMDFMNDILENADLPPEMADMLSSMGGDGLAMGVLLVGLMFNLVIYAIFAGIGGAIGVAIFVKKPPATA